MYNITLVSTFHSELGKCNSDELYKIFESINPDVIFEEILPRLVERAYNKIPVDNGVLELKSVIRYLLGHKIKHIGVDIEPDQTLSSRIDHMLNTFKKYRVCQDMEAKLKMMIERDGFAFLNSEKCMELLEEKKRAEIKLMKFMGSMSLLSPTWKLFYEEQDKREASWIKNIYNYTEDNPFDKAIFIFGVGHRRSLIKKIQQYERKEESKLNWTFYNNK